MANYGEKVKYEVDKEIEFPDFGLTFIDIVRHESLVRKRFPITNYVFQIKKGNQVKYVRWGSGTGLVMPIKFKFDNKIFWIELTHSKKLGKLMEEELVISNEDPGIGQR